MVISSTCSVCVELFNKARKQVVCIHCNMECCTDCIARYLETSGITPQCMQCHHMWSHQHVRENFGSSFVKKMADARKRVLFNEQQALFPHTQEYIKLTNRSIQLYDDEIALGRVIATTPFSDFMKRSLQFRTERMHLRTRINMIENPVRVRTTEFSSTTTTTNTTPTKVYIKPCGHGDCKGYVNADDFVCELCEMEHCPECMETKEENHRCKPADIATANMMRKDTKGCPKCTAPIHRISGCPDMFCVQCKTAFNWHTLCINERGNSNPHYYQWLRSRTVNGSSLITPTCGDTRLEHVHRSDNFISLNELHKDNLSAVIFRLHHYTDPRNVTNFYKEFRKTREFRHDFRTITLKSRADYMQNKITKEKFMQYLLKTNKAMEYNNNLDDIVHTIRMFHQQLIQYVVHSTEFDYEKFMTESNNFTIYINKCVSHLEEVYYTKKEKKFIR